MNRFSAVFLAIVFSLTAGAAVAMNHGHGAKAEAKAGDITVSAAWARASAGMAKAGGAFMTVTSGGAADTLVSASSDVSAKTELHTHTEENGVMKMREVPGIDVPAGGTVMLQPGGFHVMFIGLHAGLKEGQTFPVTLTFKKAGAVTVNVTVKKVGSMGHNMNHGDMPMGKDGAMPAGHGKMPMGH